MTDVRSVLQQAGFKGQALETALAIAMAESGGNARAHNGNAGTGDNSYGLFQINMLGAMGPQRRTQYGLSNNDALFDPLTNAKVAYKLSNGGQNWDPWSTYKNGAYRRFLGSTPAGGTDILAGAESPGVPDAPASPAHQDINAALQSATNMLGHGSGETIQPLPPSSGDFSAWIASLRSRIGPMTLEDISKPLEIPGLNGTGGAGGPWTDGSLMPSVTGQSNGADPFGTTAGGSSSTGGAASGQANSIIEWAKQFVGTPYVWGGNNLHTGVDCSGLVQQVFRHFGLNLPRLAADQANSGQRVALNQMKPGDLVAWDDNPYQRGADHIAIYVGNGMILEAPRPGLSVRVRALGGWSADRNAWGVQILH